MPEAFQAAFLVSIKSPVSCEQNRSIPLQVRKKTLAPTVSEEITTPRFYFCSSLIITITKFSKSDWLPTVLVLALIGWCNAPINVKPAGVRGGGGGGRAWGGDWTFFKNLSSNSLPTGKSFQSNATKFPHPGLHIAIIHPKAECKKGTMKISPNKILQSLTI